MKNNHALLYRHSIPATLCIGLLLSVLPAYSKQEGVVRPANAQSLTSHIATENDPLDDIPMQLSERQREALEKHLQELAALPQQKTAAVSPKKMKARHLFADMDTTYNINSAESTVKTAPNSPVPAVTPSSSKGVISSSSVPMPTISKKTVTSPVIATSSTADAAKEKAAPANQGTFPTLQKTSDTPSENVAPAHGQYAASSSKNDTAIGFEDEGAIEFHFENADLQNLVAEISNLFNVVFITDDSIYPKRPDGKGVQGSKISFKTHKPLTYREAWDLFISFLDMTGLAIIPEAKPNFYRITSTALAKKSPIAAFIGVDAEKLPDNDEIIRYVYFLENISPDLIKTIMDPLRSAASSLSLLTDLKAFLLVDKAYNIKALMRIVKELDKVTMPQSMSVLRLRKTDVAEVEALYKKIIPNAENSSFWGARKQPTTLYFPENIRVISEPRTNSLILLGQKDAIKKIEDFIIQYIDVDLETPYSPLRIYQLKYAAATTVADIMNNVTQFNTESAAGKYGGVRGGDKYLRPITFTAEIKTNRLIIRGHEEDYLKAKEILDKIDEPQPQVAIEVLILSLHLDKSKELGAQIRKKFPGVSGLLGNNVTFQTSGLLGKGIEEQRSAAVETGETATSTPGVQRLLGNMLNLITGAGAGNTILSLGKDMFDVWGVLRMLDSVTKLNVVSNPFLIATNNTLAVVTLGETKRIITSTTFAANGSTNNFGDAPANLQVKVLPQINSDGMIVLSLNIDINEFVGGTGDISTKKNITTKTIVANKEVLALGGLIKNSRTDIVTQTPILGSIPLIGWLFKNKSKLDVKDNLLVLISTRIIEPFSAQVSDFTKIRMSDYKTDVANMVSTSDKNDPIHRWFFEEPATGTDRAANKFFFKRKKVKAKKAYRIEQERLAREQRASLIKKNTESPVVMAQQNTKPTIHQAPAMPQPRVALAKKESKNSISRFFADDQKQGVA